MEKTIFEVLKAESPVENVIYGDSVIKVKKFLNLQEIVILVKNYVFEMFSEDNVKSFSDNAITAEYGLKYELINMATNISIDNVDIDNLILSGVYEQIISKISNLDDVLRIISIAVEQKRYEMSFSNQVIPLIESATETIKKLSAVDFSDTSVKQMLESANEIMQLAKSQK